MLGEGYFKGKTGIIIYETGILGESHCIYIIIQIYLHGYYER